MLIVDHGKVIASGTQETLRRMLPPSTTSRVEIEGAVDDDVLALLASRGIAVRGRPGSSLEDVFLDVADRVQRSPAA